MKQPSNKPQSKKLSEIVSRDWGFINFKGEEVRCEPSAEEIGDALKNKEFEERPFTVHREELIKEWLSGGDDEYVRRSKTYHARRIAHFVYYGWDGSPIELTEDGKVLDGFHRLKAAAWKLTFQNGKDEVEIRILGEK